MWVRFRSVVMKPKLYLSNYSPPAPIRYVVEWTTYFSSCVRPAAGSTRSAPVGQRGRLCKKRSTARATTQRSRRNGAPPSPRSKQARVAVFGIPSDCGAGLVRGAAFGPEAVRAAMLRALPRFSGARRPGRRGGRRRRVRRSAAADRRHAERGPAPPHAHRALRSGVGRQRQSAGGAADGGRAGRRPLAGGGARPEAVHDRRRSLGRLAGGGGAGASRARALGHRARRRPHRSLARAAGDPDLLRDLGVSRQRVAGAGRASGSNRCARVVASQGALGVDVGRETNLVRRSSRERGVRD